MAKNRWSRQQETFKQKKTHNGKCQVNLGVLFMVNNHVNVEGTTSEKEKKKKGNK